MMTTKSEIAPNNRENGGSAGVLSLVKIAKQGNRNAFNRLIDLFHEDIFRMVYYRIQSRMDAEDITQDTFTRAFKNIDQLKTIEHFKSWLYRIAVNRVRDFYRKKKFRSLIGIFSENVEINENEISADGKENPNALEIAIRKDFWRQLEIAMECLSKMEKEIFLLRFFDHLGIREISQTLSKNESTVKTHLYRALAKLKDNSTLQNLYNKEIV